jgi:hypothetical protein
MAYATNHSKLISWPHRLGRPRTPGFQPGNRGSNPLGAILTLGRTNHIWQKNPSSELTFRFEPSKGVEKEFFHAVRVTGTTLSAAEGE